MVGSDLDSPFPDAGVVLVPADQHDSASARCSAYAPRRVVADQDERCRLPAAAALRHPVVDLRPRARRGAQAQQVVEEFGVLRDDQWSALPPVGGGRQVVMAPATISSPLRCSLRGAREVLCGTHDLRLV